jgi:hypothetical protein
MPTLEDLFLRLSRLARRAPALPPAELPPGLANRVLAQVRAEQDAEGRSLWARLSLGALPFAAAIAALCVIVSYAAKQEPPHADADLLVQHLLASGFEP